MIEIVNPELFVVPDGLDYILYLPLEGGILRVPAYVIGALQHFKKGITSGQDDELLAALREHRVIVPKERPLPAFPTQLSEYKPTGVTLLPTYDCNLRCIYCYSTAGEQVGKSMPFEIAMASIDHIIANALERHVEQVELRFHGGGEPFVAFDVIQESVAYFERRVQEMGLRGSVSSVTNGLLSDEKIQFVFDHFNNLNISCDGPADIQNRQRPRAGGQDSFERVLHTISSLEAAHFPYSLRATVTNFGVHRMLDTFQYFEQVAPSASVHFEPLFECGRCYTTNTEAPEPKEFLEGLLEVQKYAMATGREVQYSGLRLGTLRNRFCGATGSNFFVTPQGDITTCLEVSRRTDTHAPTFMIGAYNLNEKRFDVDDSKLDTLRARTVENMSSCGNCIAKFNCGGDCPVKVLEQTNNLNDSVGNERCSINRGVVLYQITEQSRR